MAFGLSFGAKKEKGSSSTTINKNETMTQNETGSKATTGTTTQAGTSTTTGSQTGQTTNVSNQQSTGSQTNQQQSQLFSDQILGGLEGIITDLFGATGGAAPRLASDFNKQAFIDDGYSAAESRTMDDLNTGLNSIYDSIGGRDDSNSMATLLANRARGDAAANLAGVRANLTKEAEGIARDNYGADLSARGADQGFLHNLLVALKGGTASTSGAIQTAETVKGSQAGTTAQQTSETTNQQQTTTQDLLELLTNSLTGTSTMSGTENSKTKGKQFGGGFSLGF